MRREGEEEVAHGEYAGKVSGRGDARTAMNLAAAIHRSEEEEDDVASDVELPRFLGSVMTTSTAREALWRRASRRCGHGRFGRERERARDREEE